MMPLGDTVLVTVRVGSPDVAEVVGLCTVDGVAVFARELRTRVGVIEFWVAAATAVLPGEIFGRKTVR